MLPEATEEVAAEIIALLLSVLADEAEVFACEQPPAKTASPISRVQNRKQKDRFMCITPFLR